MNQKKGAHVLEGDDDFLYSNHSEYIHATMTGMTPSRNDTWHVIKVLICHF